MKERPILFSGPIVRALLDGRKTQTRRVVKGVALDWLQPGMFTPQCVASPDGLLCPYGFAGDRLWVRETFIAFGRWKTLFNAKKGREEWHFADMTLECDRIYQYAVDMPEVPLAENRGEALPGWWNRPSIFMPRAASRLTLELIDVRVERLQDIRKVDALAEGCPVQEINPVGWYAELWDGLNAARGFGWRSNPWVWVVEFKRLTQT